MLNRKLSAGYIIGLVLGAGLVLLATVLSAPNTNMLDDAMALMLFLALGGCLIFWWVRLRQQ
jgi:hypothetical protein